MSQSATQPESTQPDSAQLDPAEFRRVLGHFPTGVTVVTAATGAGPVGVAIGSFASISLDPPLVGFFLGSSSASGETISEANGFCVNVLRANQIELCGKMASKDDDKFDGVGWSPTPTTGSPLLSNIVASIDCRLEKVITVGDHDLFVGRVAELSAPEVDDEAESLSPMVFYQGKYGKFCQ